MERGLEEFVNKRGMLFACCKGLSSPGWDEVVSLMPILQPGGPGLDFGVCFCREVGIRLRSAPYPLLTWHSLPTGCCAETSA